MKGGKKVILKLEVKEKKIIISFSVSIEQKKK